MRLVEMRQFSDRSVNGVRFRFISVCEEGDICLDRTGCFDRQSILIEGREDRLAAYHEDLRISGDLICRSKDVGKFVSLHARVPP